ncbi:MAG: helix-turn-helix transcriptional regulator [Clostridiaceae bacterium]|nr:helix-turn-helix transcriptional regulator [Clostridiaceae bacterium]
MELYGNIRQYVKENGIKNTYVYEKAGMTQSAFLLALNGKRKLTADEYVAICKALNVPLDKFVANNKA